jgi:nitrogen fixation-related uncharacterized protein
MATIRPDPDKDLLELIEYRLTERVHDRVVKRYTLYITIVIGVLAVIGTVAGGLALWAVKSQFELVTNAAKSDIEKIKNELERQGKQKQDELAATQTQLSNLLKKEAEEFSLDFHIQAADVKDRMMAYRANIQDFVELQRGARLGTLCQKWPTVTEVITWLKEQQETDPSELGISVVMLVMRQYNICDLRELSAVLSLPEQNDILELYLRILGRTPDIFGKIVWGWRLAHSFPKQVVEGMIRESDEARQRGR